VRDLRAFWGLIRIRFLGVVTTVSVRGDVAMVRVYHAKFALSRGVVYKKCYPDVFSRLSALFFFFFFFSLL
jgi:hypothetical protein